MVPKMAGFNEVKNMMTSFPVFDTFIFSDVARPVEIYMLSLI